MKLQRYVEPIAAFARRAFDRERGLTPPLRALFLTYDLDLELFERDVLPFLARRGRAFRTVVIRDASTPIIGLPAASYELRAAFVKSGAFHPKLWLLQAGSKWCFGIGSSNVTSGGLGGNLELMSVAEGDPDRDPRAASVRSFLQQLGKSDDVALDRRTRRVLRTFAETGSQQQKQQKQHSGAVLSTLQGPLLDQIRAGMRGRSVREVHVVSPPYAGNLHGDAGLEMKMVGALKRAFAAPISIYTEATGAIAGATTYNYEDRRFAVARNDVVDVAADDVARESEADEVVEHDHRPARLHAKLVLLATERGNWRLYVGSPNLTVPALLRRPGRGGNLEIVRAEDVTPVEGSSIVRDLKERFIQKIGGRLDIKKTARTIGAGRVLSGWEEGRTIYLGLKHATKTPIVVTSGIGTRVTLRPRSDTVALHDREVKRLGLALPLEVPVRLDEIDGGKRYPFFVSPSVVAPITTGMTLEETLVSVANELEGIRIATKTRRSTSEPRDPGDEDEDTDPVTALTATGHDGRLDKVAKLLVRIERGSQSRDQLRSRLREARVLDNEAWATLVSMVFDDEA